MPPEVGGGRDSTSPPRQALPGRYCEELLPSVVTQRSGNSEIDPRKYHRPGGVPLEWMSGERWRVQVPRWKFSDQIEAPDEQKDFEKVSLAAFPPSKTHSLPVKRKVPVAAFGVKGTNERYSLRSSKSNKQNSVQRREPLDGGCAGL